MAFCAAYDEGMGVDEENPLLPNLPVAIHCLLRVPRLHHGLLRCVCRRWRRLLASPTFFDLRVSQNLSQERLCVVLLTPSGAEKWFAFDDDMRLLVPLPALPHHVTNGSLRGAAWAVAAGKLYMIGGLKDERACWAFNPRNNQWEAAESMKIARLFAAAGVIAGQIYVLGGCLPGAESWAEKYDPLTNQWSNILSSPDKRYESMYPNAVLHDKLFAVARKGGIIFNPLNSTWDCMSHELHSMWKGRGAVVNNILFCCNNYRGELYGYDLDKDRWLQVRGWESEVPTKLDSSALLTNVGGKLYMLWFLQTAETHSEFALTALNIVKQPGMLRGEVIWYHVISCNVECTSLLEHSVSLAL